MLLTQRIALLAALVATGIPSLAHADVSISSKPTANMSCDAGVCTATAQKAMLNVGDLQTMLASGDVAVQTGTIAKDIDVDHPLTWATTNRLTLDAQQSVTVNKSVTVSGTGNLTVVTNDSSQPKNKTGEFIIVPEHGSVQFSDLASSLIIDGNSYTLVGDIKTLAADVAANPSGFYALAKPYDASADGAYSSAPVQTEFRGKFEGLGNTIANMSIIFSQGQDTEFLGLFAQVDPSSTIRDLGLPNISFSGERDVLVGGAIVAVNEGMISRTWATGNVDIGKVGPDFGGLVGGSFGTIAHCHADVHIKLLESSSGFVGGLSGENYGTIAESYSLGSIIVSLSSFEMTAGGLVGLNNGSVENAFARGGVRTGHKVGSGSEFGGLIGENDSTGRVTASYAADKLGGVAQLGGLIGIDDAPAGNIANSYWDLDMGVSDPSKGAGNKPNDPGITGLTDAQLKSALPAGFNPNVWGSDPNINNGYPYLLANPPQ